MASLHDIKIGTDCSGMEAPIQAIRNLEVNFEHTFSCDVNPHARATIEANFPHGLMYHDLTKRDNKKAPKVDVYVAGFPCQPFSSAGLQQGFKDTRGRGEIFFHVLDYLATQRPRVFILENVSGLVTLEKGTYMNAILKELQNLGVYNVQWKILDTKQQGVPHSRRRWYCVGIHKDFDDGSFKFPEPIKCPSIELFLEARDPQLAATGMPPSSQTTATRNVRAAIQKERRAGFNPFKEAFIVDCDSSAERSKSVRGISPCITVSRGGGHWITNRGRRSTKEEMMRLQGMDPTQFQVAVSKAQLGKQLGNTMSVNTFERLLTRVLPAAKLVRHGDVTDRWADGTAARLLSRTCGRGFMPLDANAKKILANKGKEKKAGIHEAKHKRKAPATTMPELVAKRQPLVRLIRCQ